MNEFAAAGAQNGLTPFQRSLELERVYPKGRSASPRRERSLRILTWNIGRGHAPSRLAETLIAVRPDIACLQEVDWGNERTGGADVLDRLCEATGMQGLYGIEFLELPSRHRRAWFAGGGATGNALLTRFQPEATFRVELPPCLDWHDPLTEATATTPRSLRRRLRREQRIGRRFGLGAEFRIGRRKLRVCSLHLEDKYGGIAGRWSQYQAAVAALDGPTPCVIAGDFNTFDSRVARWHSFDSDTTALGKPREVSETAWWRTKLLPRTGYTDPFPDTAWTFAVPPVFRAKLDWITTNACTVRHFGVGPFSSSDHRPIWIDLEL
jgi:endonuclease/exonuclease/phosphatase family metal-dependent hydrolase